MAEDDAGPAFERYLFRGAELQATDRALTEVMRDRPDAMQAAAQKVGLLELVREVMTRAQDAGAIRTDAEAEDIPMLMCGLGTSTPGIERPVRLAHLVAAVHGDRDRRPQGAGHGRDAPR